MAQVTVKSKGDDRDVEVLCLGWHIKLCLSGCYEVPPILNSERRRGKLDVTDPWVAAKVTNKVEKGIQGTSAQREGQRLNVGNRSFGVSKGRGIGDKAFQRAGTQSKVERFKEETMANNAKCRGEPQQDNTAEDYCLDLKITETLPFCQTNCSRVLRIQSIV